jgi:YD repeat-containing protein
VKNTRSGQTRTSVFDSRNRETRTDWSGNTPDITRSFDAAGRILSENNGAVSLSYSYDAANQLLRETQSVTGQTPHTLSYSYDLDGNRTGVQYPSGSQLGLGYNGRNLPGRVFLSVKS